LEFESAFSSALGRAFGWVLASVLVFSSAFVLESASS